MSNEGNSNAINLYYVDERGARALVTPAELQVMAEQGLIVRNTTIENDRGQTTTAGNLRRLIFPLYYYSSNGSSVGPIMPPALRIMAPLEHS